MTKKKEEKVDYKQVAEELAEENARLNEAMLRERADAMNVRKRAEEEKLRLAGYYKALVVRELLPIIDNFERALRAIPADLEHHDYIKGIQGVVRQFEQILSKIGVERIKALGEHFDPDTMEAVVMDGEGEGEHEIVSEELQSGYKIGDEVIRHAMVKVRNSIDG